MELIEDLLELPYNENYLLGMVVLFLGSILSFYFINFKIKNKNTLKEKYNSINDIKKELNKLEKVIKIRFNYFSVIKIFYIAAILIFDNICWLLANQTDPIGIIFYECLLIIRSISSVFYMSMFDYAIIMTPTYVVAIDKLIKFRNKMLYFIKNYETNHENRTLMHANGLTSGEFSEFFGIIKNLKRMNLDQNKFILITTIEVFIFCIFIPYFWLIPITLLFFSMNNIIIKCIRQITKELYNLELRINKGHKNDNVFYKKVSNFMINQLILQISIFLIKELFIFIIFKDQIFNNYIGIVFPIFIFIIIEFIIFLSIILFEFISIIKYKKYIECLQK
ncbi:MAG: hypothetical protein ACTSRP_20495 [Candidatus Helarchaeota archaeon]